MIPAFALWPSDPLVLCGLALLSVVLLVALVVIGLMRRRVGQLRAELQAQSRERGRAEDARLESEAFYHSLVESLPQNIFRKDCEGRFTFANRRFCATLERPLDEIIGRTDHDFYPDALAEKYRHDDLHVLRTGETLEDVEANVTPEGEVRRVQVTKTPLRDPSGRIIGLIGIFWDVTEQYRALEALAVSEERFALAVRGSNDGLWDWNLQTNDVYYSPRFKQLLGFAEAEFPNRFESFHDRLHPDDVDHVDEMIHRHLHDREPFDVEYRLQGKDGNYHWFHARGQAVWDESGQATRMAGSISDIHARKVAEELLKTQNLLLQEMALSERQALEQREQAQSRMVESAKLAGLGQLVAGVAHEINNPLAFVSNNVAVLQRDLADLRDLIRLYNRADGLLAEHEPGLADEIAALCEQMDIDYTLDNLSGLLDRTRDGLRRIRDIVRDLRVFARLDEDELDEVNLNAGITSTINIITGYAKKKPVEVHADLGQLPPVACNAAKINQVLLNLIVNAIDACEAGGTVSIRSSADGDDGVLIEVQDDGCGIAPEIRDRIFDPFFTTKPVGVGTGLGLSISYGIVQDHGGTIEVESRPGAGSQFSIKLPLHPRVRTAEPARQES